MRKQITAILIMLSTITLLGAGCVKNEVVSTDNQQPSISVSNQTLKDDSQIIIEKASIGDNGWIVIHQSNDGQPGPIIGYTSLLKGSDTNIKITIDKNNISPYLIAELHYDRGEKGVFEFPGTDGPVIKDQQVIMKEFSLSNYAEISKKSSQNPAGPRKEFIITAKQWSFSPSVIKVKKGDMVVLKLKSADVTHGFSLPDFGINSAIKPGETKVVEFTVDKTGTFKFICDIPCGVGHMGMTGTIIVE